MTITKTIARDLPNGGYLQITAEERSGSGSLSPGFSLVGGVWDKSGNLSGRARKRMGRDIDAGGPIHELILAIEPALKPLADIHLADPDGVPMHAVANGWYFYSSGARRYEEKTAGQEIDGSISDHNRAAAALNIEPSGLPEGLDHDGFVLFVESLRPHYLAMAKAARGVLDGLIHDQGIEHL